MARRLLFWLFVTKMKIPRDNNVLPSGFLSANAASAESGDQPEVGKWFCQYYRALFDDGGWWMVMLDNNLYLVSVVWFLRRSHVDRGTRGGIVVVGTDLSKRKVSIIIFESMQLLNQILRDSFQLTTAQRMIRLQIFLLNLSEMTSFSGYKICYSTGS